MEHLRLLLCTYMGINLFRYTAEMDSDVAAEGLTARAMWVHGTIIPEEFYGSSETRILNVNLLAAGLYGLTGDMNLSMGIACSVMMALLIGLYVVLLRRLRFRGVSVAAMVLFLLAAPVTLRHAQILYVQAVYYCIHCILMLVTLMMWLRVMHEGRGSRGWIWRTAVTSVLAFVISLSGLRAALICYAPLMVTEMLRVAVMLGTRRVRSGERTDGAATQSVRSGVLAEARNAIGNGVESAYGGDSCEGVGAVLADGPVWYRGSMYTFVTLVFAYLGTRMPTSISMGTTRNIRHGLSKLAQNVILDMLECLSLGEQDAVRNVLLIVLLLIAVGTVIGTVVMAIRGNVSQSRVHGCATGSEDGCAVASDRTWILVFFILSLVTTMLMCAFTTTESVWRYYFMIWFVISFAIGLLMDRLSAGVAAYGVAGLILLYGGLGWRAELLPILRSPVYNAEYEEIISWMQENDCYYGYSTYETSNAMTGYADGAVQISAVADLGQMDICKWLTDGTWYGPYVPEDTRTAYIVPLSLGEAFAPMREAHEELELALETEHYEVYVSPVNYSWQ